MSELESISQHTLPKLGARIAEIIQDMYDRPYCYAATPIELDTTIRDYHWFWAAIHQREPDLDTALQRAMPDGRRSITGSFSRLFRFESPSGTESDEIQFVCRKWKEVSRTLGVV
jgi:hypothetical protein